MRVDVLTIFPEMFPSFLETSIVGLAHQKGNIATNVLDIRDFSQNKHKKVDDYPYGGGGGMVMSPQPLADAIRACNYQEADEVIYFTPQGKPLLQQDLHSLKTAKRLILVCGHYKDIDQRIRDKYVTKEFSIGDYVLSGGELPAMIFIDGIARLLDGVLGNIESALSDSFEKKILGAPSYTRPEEFEDMQVPAVLLGGNHAHIDAWRKAKALEITKKNREDLLK